MKLQARKNAKFERYVFGILLAVEVVMSFTTLGLYPHPADLDDDGLYPYRGRRLPFRIVGIYRGWADLWVGQYAQGLRSVRCAG